MAGLPTDRNHEDLEFLVLRKYTPEERIAIVREAIYRTENIGLVVIDGIRDMVHDINNPGESTTVISYLMTWTGERDIHIHTILHQNKGDENARGHIGTELSNKAETVLQVEKDEKNPDISTVKAAHIRASGLRAVRIPHQRGGIARTTGRLPVQGEGSGQREEGEVRPLQGHHRAAAPHRTGSRIHPERRIRLQGTCGSIEEAYASVGVILGGNRLTDLITLLKNKRMIVQENGRKYTFKPDFHY